MAETVLTATKDSWPESAYKETSHRTWWCYIHWLGLQDTHRTQEVSTHPQNELQCHECGRSFCEGDKTRHKCITEHQKPISGSAICPTCNHWFCSQGWQPCSNTDTTANRLRHQNKSKPLPAGRTGTMSWVSTLVLENKCMIKPNQTQMHSWKTKTTEGTVVITTCEIWAEVWLYRCEPNI